MPHEHGGMIPKHFILATAGHVDHGKTALVQALTGVDTDRLPEEKARGITIDLGFAHLALPGFSIGLIDVPGHEDFVRNMIAGVGSLDLALLVVAADDGWMPQTEEHLQILSYLGVTRAVVALTKSDLGRVDEREVEIRAQLQGTPFASAPIVATSVRTQTGISELKQALMSEFNGLAEARDFAKPRLFVDRVFTVRGTGTIVTGSLSGGRFSRGDNVVVQPRKLATRIRGMQSHNQPLDVAGPQTRVGLNLADLSPDQISRGATIILPGAGDPARVIDVLLERSPRQLPPARPLRNGSSLNFHYGGARRSARVHLLERKELLPNESAIARLRLDEPVFAMVSDRFILRDSSEQLTIAGGTVLDAEPGVIKFRSGRQRNLLGARAHSPNDLSTLVQSQLERDQSASRDSLLRKAPFSEKEIVSMSKVLERDGRIFLGEKIAANAKWWQSLRRAVAGLVDAEHVAHPQKPGLEINRLREALNLGDGDVFDALLHALANEGFVQNRNMIQRASHRPSLPPELRETGDRIRRAMSARPFDPPSRKEIAVDAAAQQALHFFCETGELIALGDDVLISADGFAKLKTMLVQHLGAGRAATVSELRQVTGTTRRLVVPLLERLDRLGLTIREGDRRKLR